MFQACDGLGEVRWKSHLGEGLWSGEDVKDFILVLVYTGLRISDVATFPARSLTVAMTLSMSRPTVEWPNNPPLSRV